jgi:hypothetical protein
VTTSRWANALLACQVGFLKLLSPELPQLLPADPSIVFSGTPRWFALQPPSFTAQSVEDEAAAQFGGMANGAVMRGQQQQQQQQRSTRFRDYNPGEECFYGIKRLKMLHFQPLWTFSTAIRQLREE